MRFLHAGAVTMKTLWGLLTGLLGAVAVIGIIAWMSGAFRSKVPPGTIAFQRQTLAEQKTIPVESLATTQRTDAVGTIEPRRKTEIASRLLATIEEVTVDPGDRVEKGQLLATLDDREIQAQLREAEAAVAGIEANLAVRQREQRRYRQMLDQQAVSQESFD